LQPAPAPRFDRTPAAAPRPAPRTGEHTQDILLDAGFSADEIAALRAAGACA
jgi:alpha-methylacyl-CoA racemase